jgi:hypothetical protein
MSEWQPIDTAPKDGRLVVLGWLPNGLVEHKVISSWKRDHWHGGWTPTHWRPLQGAVCADHQRSET